VATLTRRAAAARLSIELSPAWTTVALGGVLLLAAGLRLAYLIALWQSPLFLLNALPGLDMATYFSVGQAFAAGRLPQVGAPLFQAPLYPLLLGGLIRLAGPSLAALCAAQVVLGVLACGLLDALGRRLGGPALGLLAAGLYAVYPIAWYYGGLLLSENLLVVLLLALALAAARALDGRDACAWLGVGVLCGLASLTKPNAVLVLPALLLLAWWQRTLTPRAAALALLACGLLVLPPTLYNSLAAGAPQFVSGQGEHLWLAGTTTYATGLYQLPCGPPLDPWSGSFWGLQARKLVLFFSNTEFGNNTNLAVFRTALGLGLLGGGPMGFGFGSLAGLGLLGLVGVRGQSARWRAPLLILAIYSASIVLFVIVGRYRLPAAALLCLPAAALLLRLPRLLRDQRRRLGLALAGVLVLSLAANTNLPPDVSLPFAHANAATVFAQAGDATTAQRELTQATAAAQDVAGRDPHGCAHLPPTWDLGR